MINLTSLLIILSFIKPVVSLSSSEVHIQDDPLYSSGPMEIRVDMHDDIYIREVGDGRERILKYDSNGMFVYIIDSVSLPDLIRVSFCGMTIDPITNDLILSGRGIGKGLGISVGVSINPRSIPTNKIKLEKRPAPLNINGITRKP